jgi:hypothetical protein
MYEARDRFDEANTLYQVAVKKYSSSKKVRTVFPILVDSDDR